MDKSFYQTRPRVYKIPQVCLDDISDTEVRDKIIKYTYTTDWEAACEYSAIKVPTKSQKVPNTTMEDINAKKVNIFIHF